VVSPASTIGLQPTIARLLLWLPARALSTCSSLHSLCAMRSATTAQSHEIRQLL
jgi:hypothetical protein